MLSEADTLVCQPPSRIVQCHMTYDVTEIFAIQYNTIIKLIIIITHSYHVFFAGCLCQQFDCHFEVDEISTLHRVHQPV